MNFNRFTLALCVLGTFLGAFFLGKTSGNAAGDSQPPHRVFEIRTYTAEDGKLDALLTRFRDHTCQLFEKHGMTNIGYWIPQDEPKSKNTLIYIIAHPSRETAKKNWLTFKTIPNGKK